MTNLSKKRFGNAQLYYKVKYTDGDKADMLFYNPDEDSEDSSLLDTLDHEVLDRIRPVVMRMFDTKKFIFG